MFPDDAVVNATYAVVELESLVTATLAAFVALDAVPVKLAVIVPAAKFPLASRTTTLLAVFVETAST